MFLTADRAAEALRRSFVAHGLPEDSWADFVYEGQSADDLFTKFTEIIDALDPAPEVTPGALIGELFRNYDALNQAQAREPLANGVRDFLEVAAGLGARIGCVSGCSDANRSARMGAAQTAGILLDTSLVFLRPAGASTTDAKRAASEAIAAQGPVLAIYDDLTGNLEAMRDVFPDAELVLVCKHDALVARHEVRQEFTIIRDFEHASSGAGSA